MIVEDQVDNKFCLCVGHYISKHKAIALKSTPGQVINLGQAVHAVDYIITVLLLIFIVTAKVERRRFVFYLYN